MYLYLYLYEILPFDLILFVWNSRKINHQKINVCFENIFFLICGVGWVRLHHIFHFRYIFIDIVILSLRDKKPSIIHRARVMVIRAREYGFYIEKEPKQCFV